MHRALLATLPVTLTLSVFALVIAIARSHSPAPWLGAR